MMKLIFTKGVNLTEKDMTSIHLVAQFEIDDKIYLIYKTGKYNPKTSQIPNHLPYDASRYMHRHRMNEVESRRKRILKTSS